MSIEHAEREIEKLKAERDRFKRERDGWESDALQYCQNAGYWREQHGKLRTAAEDEIAANGIQIRRLRAALEKALGALPGSADWHEARRALEETPKR
jgi:hypothetical protein